MLQIVSDCTGYPVEMLELEQEIDADLGIDSIKRMQAMTELESALGMHGTAGRPGIHGKNGAETVHRCRAALNTGNTCRTNDKSLPF